MQQADPAVDGTTELVEVSDGMAIVFGPVPEGLDIVPFSLVDSTTKSAMTDAMAVATGVGNVGAQVAAGVRDAQGLVRLAPETLQALRAGKPMTDGVHNLGAVVGKDGKIAAQFRWSPAGGAQAATVLAAVGPAAAMLAIQVQLAEIGSLVRENIALTAEVLRTVRAVQESKLAGLAQTIEKAIDEAEHIGEVTTHIWRNVEGKDADLRESRRYFLQQTEAHLRTLGPMRGHKERRDYLEKHGDAVIADAHGLLLAQSVWFRYQALRAGHLQRDARSDQSAAALLEKVVQDACEENERSLTDVHRLLEQMLRETSLLAELPGKRTLPFSGERKAARVVAKMARDLSAAIEKVQGVAVSPIGQQLAEPGVVAGPRDASVTGLLQILRWHMNPEEALLAIADTSQGFKRWGAGYLAVTSERILITGQKEFEKEGVISKQVPVTDIRYVRFKPGSGDATPTIDIATRDEDIHMSFGSWSRSPGARRDIAEVADVLRTFMNVPSDESAPRRLGGSPDVLNDTFSSGELGSQQAAARQSGGRPR